MLVTVVEAATAAQPGAGADRAGAGDHSASSAPTAPARPTCSRRSTSPSPAAPSAPADRRDLIPFGGAFARAEATVRDEDGIERHLLASVSRAEGRRHLLDGSPADPATLARSRPPVAVFSPDRLALVKGPPAERRAHLDGFLAARWPARADLRQRYGQALAQRNALVARLAAGHGAPGRARCLGRDPRRGRRGADRGARRGGGRAGRAFRRRPPQELGSRAARRSSTHRARSGSAEEIRAGLAERREADLRLGRTLLGPAPRRAQAHRRGGRSLRRYGSQGQQRAGLLALLFAEREVADRGPPRRAAAAARRRDERARPRAPRAPGRAPRGAAARR